jgi:hypothetical protein
MNTRPPLFQPPDVTPPVFGSVHAAPPLRSLTSDDVADLGGSTAIPSVSSVETKASLQAPTPLPSPTTLPEIVETKSSLQVASIPASSERPSVQPDRGERQSLASPIVWCRGCVDVVYLWVNGTDPWFMDLLQVKRAHTCPTSITTNQPPTNHNHDHHQPPHHTTTTAAAALLPYPYEMWDLPDMDQGTAPRQERRRTRSLSGQRGTPLFSPLHLLQLELVRAEREREEREKRWRERRKEEKN